MVIINNKPIIINEIVGIKQLLFSYFTFLSTTNVAFAIFNISSSHVHSKSFITRSLHGKFLISKYSPTSQVLSHSQSHVLGFHV